LKIGRTSQTSSWLLRHQRRCVRFYTIARNTTRLGFHPCFIGDRTAGLSISSVSYGCKLAVIRGIEPRTLHRQCIRLPLLYMTKRDTWFSFYIRIFSCCVYLKETRCGFLKRPFQEAVPHQLRLNARGHCWI
jgi:hypothetical protein